MTERTILIDGDVYAYQAAAGVQKVVNFGGLDDDTCGWVSWADGHEACAAAVDAIEALVEYIGGDRTIVALSHRENWRKAILPTYKSNRTAPKPMALPTVREFLRETYEVFERPGLEADDVLGILMTGRGLVPGEKICVSVDKDMRTIPGLHLNSGRRHEGIFEVSPEEADRWHLYQALIGDPVDGYTGVPNVGPVQAEEFLDKPYCLVPYDHELQRGPRKGRVEQRWRREPTEDVWAGIVSLFAHAGLGADYALQQARVARILRAEDYNFKTKEPILWTPS